MMGDGRWEIYAMRIEKEREREREIESHPVFQIQQQQQQSFRSPIFFGRDDKSYIDKQTNKQTNKQKRRSGRD